MRTLALVACLLSGLTSARADTTTSPRAERRAWGLVVCVDHYADSRLNRTDIEPGVVERLSRNLTDPKRFPSLGDRLLILDSRHAGANPDRLATAQRVRQSLANIAQNALPGDDLVVVWISRLCQEQGETRWLTFDADANNIQATSLLTGEIYELLQSIRCRNRLIVVDAVPVPTGWFPTDAFPSAGARIAPLAEWVGPDRLVIGASDGRHQPNQPNPTPSNLFFAKLSDGLAGQADRAGGEPDGWISTTELIDFLREQVPSSLVLGNDPQRWLGRNPSHRSKLDTRRAALVALQDKGELDEADLAQGLKLLERLPRFVEDQRLRQAFIELAAGTKPAAEVQALRRQLLSQRQLDDTQSIAFARRIEQVYAEILKRHVHPDDAPAALEEGCFDLAEAFDCLEEAWVAPAIADILAASPTDANPPLARFRARLGRRPTVQEPAETILVRGMLHSLDPYSAYLAADVFRDTLQQSRGRFTGIGVVLQESPWDRTLRVLMPIPGGPAAQSGLLEDDLILAVDGAATIDIGTEEASRRLSGEPRSSVSLEIARGPKSRQTLAIKREDVPLVTVIGFERQGADWSYWLRSPKNETDPYPFRPAYIRITRFARDTADRLRRILRQLESEGMTHLVLDLRFNPGGLMESAVDVADLFIDDGLILRIRDRQGQDRQRRAVRTGTFRDHQLVVLINGESASGSEIVAAAIEDNQRGIVAGSRSFGKGSIQEIVALPDAQTGLKITSALFLRGNGQNLERFLGGRRPSTDTWGVRPHPKWEWNHYREEVERLRAELARQQYLGAGPQALSNDPDLARVLAQIRANLIVRSPSPAPFNRSN